MKTQIFEYVIVFVLGLILAYALTSKYVEREKEIVVRQIHDLKDLEKIRVLQKMLIRRDTLYARLRRHDLDSLAAIDKQRRWFQARYIEIKNRPVKITTDKELDSIINQLIK